MSDLSKVMEALEIGRDAAANDDQYHQAMAGYRPLRHEAMDADVRKIDEAIAILRGVVEQQEQPKQPQDHLSCAVQSEPPTTRWFACQPHAHNVSPCTTWCGVESHCPTSEKGGAHAQGSTLSGVVKPVGRDTVTNALRVQPLYGAWLPIESAPVDQVKGPPLHAIVAYPLDNGGWHVEEAWYDAERSEWWPANCDFLDYHGEPIYPTRYMPMPAPPVDQAAGDQCPNKNAPGISHGQDGRWK